MNVMKIRHRIPEFEAVRFDGTNHRELFDWMYGPNSLVITIGDDLKTAPGCAFVLNEAGDKYVSARVGDWIVKHPNGDFFSVDPDQFAKEFEPNAKGEAVDAVFLGEKAEEFS